VIQRASLLILASLFATSALACSSRGDAPEAASEGKLVQGDYISADSYFTDKQESNSWYELTNFLKTSFDDLCGDTFCEGEYSNYESLGFTCSVDKNTGIAGSCVWVFAASNQDVTADGKVEVDAKTFKCSIKVAEGKPLRDFVKLVSENDRPLYVRFPDGRTLGDDLGDCL
jgi:hypothetical protein